MVLNYPVRQWVATVVHWLTYKAESWIEYACSEELHINYNIQYNYIVCNLYKSRICKAYLMNHIRRQADQEKII